jgi:mRNA interferase MazF
MIERGSLWWVDFGDIAAETGHKPAKRRPVLVIQSEAFNRSRLPTVTVAATTSNLQNADFPGNVLLSAGSTGLPHDSVAKLTQIATLNRWELVERAGQVDHETMRRVDEAIRTTLAV